MTNANAPPATNAAERGEKDWYPEVSNSTQPDAELPGQIVDRGLIGGRDELVANERWIADSDVELLVGLDAPFDGARDEDFRVVSRVRKRTFRLVRFDLEGLDRNHPFDPVPPVRFHEPAKERTVTGARLENPEIASTRE